MSSGLEGIIAAETVLSHVDGEAGGLIIRGHRLEEIAGRLAFEEVAERLWSKLVEPEGGALAQTIGAGRVRAHTHFLPLYPRLAGLTAVDGMRLLLASIGDANALAAPAGMVGAVGVAAAAA